MTETETMLYELLKRFQSDMGRMRESIDANTSELRALRHHMTGLAITGVNQESEVASLKLRIERLERRLDLVD